MEHIMERKVMGTDHSVNNINMPLVGEAVRRLRLRRGWSMSRLATASRLDVAVVGAIEDGSADFAPENVRAIAFGLSIDPEELYQAGGSTWQEVARSEWRRGHA
jgi:transcriptional regulator with XRE-family HTH domain